LKRDKVNDRLKLIQSDVIYCEFGPSLDKISKPEPGNIDEFIETLQDKLDEKLNNNPPDTQTLGEILLQ
jgi:hypothetical protein